MLFQIRKVGAISEARPKVGEISFSLQLIADVHIIDSKSSPVGEETMDAYINVKNFGPIEEAEIDLRPLTVFVGESNTGKTYLAALIYALHQQF